MYGIFRESLVILQNYFGRTAYLALYAVSLVYLLLREKNRARRYLLLYAPLLLIVLFLFPLSRKVYVALMDEGTTYYRLLWLVPAGVTVAYAFASLSAAHRRIGTLIGAGVVALCGSLVYRSVYISPAENVYHLPQVAIDLCDAVLPEADDEKVYAAFPGELVHYVRQYDTRIILPFGREMIEPVWDYRNDIYSAMEEEETIDMERLTRLLRQEGFDHLILHTGRKTDTPPGAYGFVKTGETGGYGIYVDREKPTQ